jgi:hypothetical protein
VPIEFRLEQAPDVGSLALTNVSCGGLAFHSDQALPPGRFVRIRIAVVRPPFEGRARVAWCRREGAHFGVGVTFVEDVDRFRLRMVEQLCYIEQYKRQVLAQEGRELSGQEAALEWIARHATVFPQFEGD